MSNPSRDTPKARILALVEDQAEDSSYDEILHEFAFVRMVERGIEDADADRVVPHEEVRRRVDAWSR
jgi:predicted transcriptional regulator